MPAAPRRVCAEPGCHALTAGRAPRCAPHAHALEQRRGSRQARGYGAAHVSARSALASRLPAVCGAPGHAELILPGTDWVAAHRVDGDPSQGWVATCRAGNEAMKRGGAGRIAGNGLADSTGLQTTSRDARIESRIGPSHG